MVYAVPVMWIFSLLIPSLVFAFTPPPNDGFLTDAAGILTGEEELTIEGVLQNYAEETGTEIAVVIVRDIGSISIEDAAKDVASRWRVGLDGEARGVLLLFAYEDRDLYMVIGDGLQGVLSPTVAQGIIERDIIPSFRNGKYAAGLEEGVGSIIKHIHGEYTGERYTSSPPSSLMIWLTSIVGIAGAAVMMMLVRGWWRRSGVRRRRRVSSRA